jgi:hypothetical protein
MVAESDALALVITTRIVTSGRSPAKLFAEHRLATLR